MFKCVSMFYVYIYMRVYGYAYLDVHVYYICTYPLTEEIRLKIFGSPDMPVFPATLLSDGDSVYSRKN